MPTAALATAPAPTQVHPLHKRALRIIKGTATFEDRYVPDHTQVTELIAILRSMGCIIAFTTGNWDLFHIGHGKYIARGKEEATKHYPGADHVIMVVGIDTDEMTRKRKGPSRPIVPEDERAAILGHLRAVDIIVPQYEENQLFRLIKHDVRIVSISTKDLPDLGVIKEQCDHLVNLEPQAETSTTARVRRLAIDGIYDRLGPYLMKLKPIVDEMSDELEKVASELSKKS